MSEEKGLQLESQAFTKIGQAYTRTVAQRAVALEASQAALGAANQQMTAAEFANLTEKFKIGTAEEISVIEGERQVALTTEEIAAEEALSAARAAMGEAEALGEEAIMAVRGVSRAGIYGLIAAVVIFGALELFSSWRESQEGQQLKSMIDTCYTARLYAQAEELTAVAYMSLTDVIEEIVDAYPRRTTEPDRFQRELDRFTKKAKLIQPNIDEVYQTLFKRDAEAGKKVEEDPSLEQMKQIHNDKIKENQKKKTT